MFPAPFYTFGNASLFSFWFWLFARFLPPGLATYKPRLSNFRNSKGDHCLEFGQEIPQQGGFFKNCHLLPNQSFQSIKMCTLGLLQLVSLVCEPFIFSITKQRIEDNCIVWTNRSVRRSICHGGRVLYLTGSDWWPGMSVSGRSSLIGCKLLTVDSNLPCSFFLPVLKTISGFWSSEGVITNVGRLEQEGEGGAKPSVITQL